MEGAAYLLNGARPGKRVSAQGIIQQIWLEFLHLRDHSLNLNIYTEHSGRNYLFLTVLVAQVQST